jgi:hypothetical protein
VRGRDGNLVDVADLKRLRGVRRAAGVREAIEKAGATPMFLIVPCRHARPTSSDRDAFAKLKALLGSIIDLSTSAKCETYFKAAGDDPD